MILWSSLNLHLLHIIKTDIILIQIIVVKMYSMLVLKNIKFPFLHYKNFKQTIDKTRPGTRSRKVTTRRPPKQTRELRLITPSIIDKLYQALSSIRISV